MVAEHYGKVRFPSSLAPSALKQDMLQRDRHGVGMEGRAFAFPISLQQGCVLHALFVCE